MSDAVQKSNWLSHTVSLHFQDAKASNLKITWVGHATALIEIGGQRLLTDPVLTRRIGPLRRHGPEIRSEWVSDIDAVLITHGHRDHLHVPSLRLIEQSAQVFAPTGMEKVVNGAVFDSVRSVSPGETVGTSDVAINVEPVHHSGFRPFFGPKGVAVGYLIENSSGAVYFPGDTGLFDELENLRGKVNVALLPVGGWGLTMRGGHLDPRAAVEAVNLIRPDCVIPIHWGTLWPYGMVRVRRSRFSGPAVEFKRLMHERMPSVDVRLLVPGETASFADVTASRGGV